MRRNEISRQDKAEYVRNYVGEGKIIILGKRVIPDDTGRSVFYELDYEDNGKTERLRFTDEDDLESIIKEFRGKNNKTVAAEDKFLVLNGWSSKELEQRGFRIRHIRIRCSKKYTGLSKKITIPRECGLPYFPKASTGKKNKKWQVAERTSNSWDVSIYATFNSQKQFDKLLNLIDRNWPEHEKIVREIGLEHNKNKSVTKWERQVAKDGTSQMELICTEVDGMSFPECLRNEILEATDGITKKICNLGSAGKRPPQLICVDADVL